MHRVKKFFNKKVKGFTLIELLISVSVIAILSVIGIASFEGSTRRAEVKNAAGSLKTDLRQIQNLAVSGEKRPFGDAACENAGTIESYAVGALPGIYRSALVVSDDTTGASCLRDLDLTLQYPWTSDNVRVVRVGSRQGATGSLGWCLPAIIYFQPIDRGITFSCWLFDIISLRVPPSDGLPAGHDRVYFEIKHDDDPLRYRVYVTRFGQIYDEQL